MHSRPSLSKKQASFLPSFRSQKAVVTHQKNFPFGKCFPGFGAESGLAISAKPVFEDGLKFKVDLFYFAGENAPQSA